jgi:hypothetical protein
MHPDHAWYFCGPLEGYRLERFGVRLVATRPDGSVCLEETAETIDDARERFFKIPDELYRSANGGERP